MTWSHLCRLGPVVICFPNPDLVQPWQAGPWCRLWFILLGIYDLAQALQTGPWCHLFPEPDLVQPLQAGPWRRFGLFSWVYMTWLRLCRLDPGVIYFQSLTWFSLNRLDPGVSLVCF